MNVTEAVNTDYLNWQRGDTITISAGTGKGKSHFVKNTLYEHAKGKGKRILFFLHRSNTLDQFKLEIEAEGKNDVIDLITYQSFEKATILKKQIDLWHYEYVICDEYHYFGNDSAFNRYTDISLNEIIDGAANRIILFMSATNDFIKEYLSMNKAVEPKEYIVPSTYDYIRTLLTERMKHAKFLEVKGSEEYKLVFYREPDEHQLVYYEPLPNGLFELKTNQLLYDSFKYKYKRLSAIQEMAGGYRQYIVELFEKQGSIHLDAYLEPETRAALAEAFETEAVFYSNEEKSEFAERLKLRSNGRLIKSFKKINEQLTVKEASYRIFKYDTKLDGIRYKTAWRVIQMPS